jgi:flagellar protein FliO/FliZ
MTGVQWTSALWFLAILALIPLALRLLKRTPMGGAAAAGAGLRSVGALALSPSQRIVTVEVGHGDDRRWLVLGVTPTNISTLYSIAPFDQPAGLPAPGATIASPGFSQLLGRLRGNGGAKDHSNGNGLNGG